MAFHGSKNRLSNLLNGANSEWNSGDKFGTGFMDVKIASVIENITRRETKKVETQKNWCSGCCVFGEAKNQFINLDGFDMTVDFISNKYKGL